MTHSYMQAIVLSRKPFREYDEIISLYTHDVGRVELLAKGNKRLVSKQSPHLEPFSLVVIAIIPGREIDHLAKTQSIDYFSSIRADRVKSFLAGFAVSVLHRLTPVHTPERQIFFTLKSWLEFLEKTPTVSLVLLDAFLMVLMGLLGFTPILEQCVVCGKETHLILKDFLTENKLRPGIYYAGGGIVCASCRNIKEKIGEKITGIGLQELSCLNLLLKGDWRLIMDFTLEPAELACLHTIVYEFVLYHSEVALRDWGRLGLDQVSSVT